MMIPASMRAMVQESPGTALVLRILPIPEPKEFQILIKIRACGVCRTDLHIRDGDLAGARYPIIPGHEVIGEVVKNGSGCNRFTLNETVGVAWLGHACGHCTYCSNGRENLCDEALFTGYTMNGGYAEYMLAWEQYCFPLPERYAHISSAPLLCAGFIGFRAYRMIPAQAERIGFYGFGAAAHILIQIAGLQQKQVYAFTRKGDRATQEFARRWGAVWAGDSDQPTPEKLDAAILFAPAGELVPKALSDTLKAGIVVCAGIHMSDIPSFPYRYLWEERIVRSVANLTREDGEDFLKLIGPVKLHTATTVFPLDQANLALEELRQGKIKGAAVLTMHQ